MLQCYLMCSHRAVWAIMVPPRGIFVHDGCDSPCFRCEYFSATFGSCGLNIFLNWLHYNSRCRGRASRRETSLTEYGVVYSRGQVLFVAPNLRTGPGDLANLHMYLGMRYGVLRIVPRFGGRGQRTARGGRANSAFAYPHSTLYCAEVLVQMEY